MAKISRNLKAHKRLAVLAKKASTGASKAFDKSRYTYEAEKHYKDVLGTNKVKTGLRKLKDDRKVRAFSKRVSAQTKRNLKK